MQVTPSGGPLGATVTGVDLAQPQTPEVRAAIRAAWLEHLVLVFPDQPLTNPEFLAFAHTLGEPGRYPFVTGIEDFPDIIEVKKLPHETMNFGGIWHSDTVYLDRPPMGSMLVAREIPPTGGDTEFANMYLAWDHLAPELREAPRGTVDPFAREHAVPMVDHPCRDVRTGPACTACLTRDRRAVALLPDERRRPMRARERKAPATRGNVSRRRRPAVRLPGRRESR